MTDKIPMADRDAIANIATLGKKKTLWSYLTDHGLHDVIRLDYFRSVASDFGLRHGDVIDCIIGPDPVEALHVRLVVDWPERLQPVCVAIVRKDRPTPVRHDGTMEEAA